MCKAFALTAIGIALLGDANQVIHAAGGTVTLTANHQAQVCVCRQSGQMGYGLVCFERMELNFVLSHSCAKYAHEWGTEPHVDMRKIHTQVPIQLRSG
jgi:hypothetical protein